MSGIQQTTTTTTTTAAAAAPQAVLPRETIVHNAAIHEVIKPTQLEEVQPVVHRQVETTEIHQVTQPILEKNVLPTQIQERVLATQVKPDVILGGPAPVMAQEQSSRLVENTQHTTIVKPAIVQEVIRPHVIEEIQPVVYREVLAPSIVHETQNINERIVEAPVVFHETRQPIMGAQQGAFAGPVMPLGSGFHNDAFQGGHPFGIGLRGEQKAMFYEQKAREWEQKGNMKKAQRNREKAARTRGRMQTRMAPGYTPKQRTAGQLNGNQNSRIQRYEQRAVAYETGGNHPLALRNQQKANFLRSKAGVSPFSYPVNPAAQPYLQQQQQYAQPRGLTMVDGRKVMPTATGLPADGMAPGHHYAPAGLLGSGLGLKGEEKALRFDNKSEEWRKAGNATKAQRNQEKALKAREKLRNKSGSKSGAAQPAQVRTPGSLSAKQQTKIQKFEQRALQADQQGKAGKAIRSREKANRIRTKSGVPHTVYPGTAGYGQSGYGQSGYGQSGYAAGQPGYAGASGSSLSSDFQRVTLQQAGSQGVPDPALHQHAAVHAQQAQAAQGGMGGQSVTQTTTRTM